VYWKNYGVTSQNYKHTVARPTVTSSTPHDGMAQRCAVPVQHFTTVKSFKLVRIQSGYAPSNNRDNVAN